MHEIITRNRHHGEADDFEQPNHPRFSRSSFIAVGGTFLAGGAITGGTLAAGAGLAGAGLNLIGQNQQKKAIQGATDANQRAIDDANKREWNNYLLQRGINTGGTAMPGEIPTNAPAVNTKLPLWAAFPTAQPGGNFGRGFRGLMGPSTPSATTTQPSAQPMGVAA